MGILAYAQKKDTIDYSKKRNFDALKERSKTKYRIIPLPSFDPSTKWGLFVVGMANYYLNKKDTISPPSGTNLFGNITTNGSWMGGVNQDFNFNQDKWRINVRAGYLSINQKLQLGEFGVADATRKIVFANTIAKRRIFNRVFLGLGYDFRSIQYEGRNEESQRLLELIGFANKAQNHGLKYFFAFDSRDNIFYAYKGIYAEYTLGQKFADASAEMNNAFLEHLVDFRQFLAIKQNSDNMIAWHFFGRFLSGNPQNENFSFYGRSTVMVQRGYEVGSFIDKNLVTAEVEYRRETPWIKRKVGFIAFMSIGKVYGFYQDFGNAEWLPAGGAGVRFRIMDYERINIKCDVAYGKDGWAAYFGIREAF